MAETTQFLINHGLPLVFGAVLLEQLGLPLPAMPWLLAAGALSASGKFSCFSAVAVKQLNLPLADNAPAANNHGIAGSGRPNCSKSTAPNTSGKPWLMRNCVVSAMNCWLT